jgi:hypothetical protein
MHQRRHPARTTSPSWKLERRYTKRSTATRVARLVAAGALVLPVTAGFMELRSSEPVDAATTSQDAVVGPSSVLLNGGQQSVQLPSSPQPTTTTTAPPATPSAPAPVGARNPGLWPYASNSPWNTPVGSGAVFEAPTGPMTSNLRAKTIRSRDGASTWNMVTWMNADTYSHPVYYATSADPRYFVTQKYGNGEWVHIPANATPAKGSDAHLHIVQPDGRTIIEMWTAQKTSAGWYAGRLEVVDLYGSGIGPDNGTRAYGGSAIGGLIRKWEVDPTDPNYTDGVIRHALAIAVPSAMLKYTDGASGYDAAGYGTARGYVWPATEQDYNSPGTYYGAVPMGAFVAIPQSVNLDALGLSPQTRAIAQALKDYGGYITDRTGGSTFSFYAEPTVPAGWVSAVTGPSWSAKELDAVRQQLRVVTNNGPTSVGGGGTPVVAPAPPLR